MIPEEVKQFVPEVGVTVEGISGDYVWYHSKILSAKMSQWDVEFQKIVNVMESRHKEHLSMIESLMMQNKMLRSELKAKNETPTK